MKWLGLGWAEYWDLPEDVTHAARLQMIAEYEHHKEALGKRPGTAKGWNRKVIADPDPVVIPKGRSLGIDPKTGHEMVERVKEDGTVVRHRKIEEGEALLWALAGKKPKSFENK